MKIERVHLGDIDVGEAAGAPCPVMRADFTNLPEYSRFKFGDGEAAARYGSLLGGVAVAEHCDVFFGNDVYVASSAYRIAPPASQGLVEPFVRAAELAIAAHGERAALQTFHVGKTRLANDGYADMTFEERRATLQSDLMLPEDMSFEGRTVVLLDDIRVTGLREEALQGLLEEAGVERTLFGYAMNVQQGREYPKIEGVLNRIAIKTLDDVIKVAVRPGFIPNLRTCKYIAAQGAEEINRFCASVPAAVAATVRYYIESEDLERIVKIVP
jgi:PRTase ComF-like